MEARGYMDTKEISELYGRMVGACRKEESDAERGAWKEVLGNYKFSDGDAACRRWLADTTVEEWTNKPRGARLPSPAELKASIERFRNVSADYFTPCGHCESGWVRVFEGRTAGWFDGSRPNWAPDNHVDNKHGAMKPCSCRIAWIESRRSA